jgi:hypothetical protein
MNRRIFHAVVLFALASCRKDPLGLTGVQLDIITSDPHLYATSFQMLWLDDSARLFEQRVPDGMGILEAPTASVFIAFDADKAGWRRVVVHGFRDDTPISEGSARFNAEAGVWTQFGLTMVPLGTLPDADGDGLPDGIDHCPRDPTDQCGVVPPPQPDASAAETGPDTGRETGVLDVVPGPVVTPTALDGGIVRD